MKFSGENFQPWPAFDLDINGLTIVIGPSNEGKSSIYRALLGLVRNELDVAYIRNPKDEPLKLTLEHDGHTIVATRSKRGSVTYIVDGDENNKFSKLDGDIPEIVKKLNFGEIKIGDFVFDPVFASQNRPQFLIDNKTYKPSEINAILGAFGGTEKLEAGKKQANLLKTQKDGEARVLAAQIRNAEERKARLGGMSAKAHALADELHALEAASRKLESESHWLVECVIRRLRLEPLQRIAEALILPDTAEVEQLQRLTVYAQQASFAQKFAQWMNKPLQAIEAATGAWNEIYSLWKQIKALNETVVLIESQFDAGDLAAFHTEISVNELARLRDSITFLENATVLRRELKETAGKLTETDDQLSAVQLELTSVQKALHDAAVEAERNRAEELMSRGLCPKCGKSMEHIC
jgi:hypothetical protein